MSGNYLAEVRSPSVMQEEEALAKPPKWRSSPLVSLGGPLCNAVGQSGAHDVNEEVGVEMDRLIP